MLRNHNAVHVLKERRVRPRLEIAVLHDSNIESKPAPSQVSRETFMMCDVHARTRFKDEIMSVCDIIQKDQ